MAMDQESGAPSIVDLLDRESIARLRRLAVRKRYADGQLIHDRGDTEARMSMVVEGAVRLVRRTRGGRLVAATTVGPGRHYGDVVAISRHQRTHEAIAVGDTVVDHLSLTAFECILKTEPAIVRALYQITAQRLMTVIDLYDDVRFLSPVNRVAKLLLASAGASSGSARVSCVQESLAQSLGLSTVTVGKCLAQLAREGAIVTGYRYIEIRDQSVLAMRGASDGEG